jgi:hypothetical protein
MTRQLQSQRDSASRTDYYQRKHEHNSMPHPDLWLATLEGVKTPEQQLLERERSQRLDHHIDQLPPRVGLAVRLKYGLRCEPHTLEQVAGVFGVTRERIRQIVDKGERLLRTKVLREENYAKWRKELDRKLAEAQPQNRWWENGRQHQFYVGEPPDPAAESARSEAAAARRRERARLELAEREAEWARQRKRNYDSLYKEAQLINDLHWPAEANRRKREAAFQQQAQQLREAYTTYQANRGTPAEQTYVEWIMQLESEWASRQAAIWKEFP